MQAYAKVLRRRPGGYPGLRHLLRTVLAICAGVASLAGAELTGTVVDASGLPIPHASVQIAGMRGETDDRGAFRFAGFPECPCRMRVERSGFEPFDRTLSGDEKTVRVELSIAARRDSVQVKANLEDAPAAIGGVSLEAAELRKMSNNPKDWVSYAELLAGTGSSGAQIYVDGMPASEMPPAPLIARIVVNPDQFSAEYSDGGGAHIDIVTKAPDRQFRFHFGSDGFGGGGGSVLAPGPGTVSHSGNGGVSGAIPRTPFAFSLLASFSESETPVAVTAVLPGAGFPAFDAARSGSSSTRALTFSPDLFYYPSEHLRFHLSRTESRSAGRNMGVGGLTLMDAGMDDTFANSETRVTYSGGDSLFYRGGFSMEQSRVESRARNTSPGLTVLGDFTTGGPLTLSSATGHLGWTWKSSLEPAAGASWSAGISMGGVEESRNDTANPGGVYTFSDLSGYAQFLAGAGAASWTGLRGNGVLHFRQFHVAPYFQRPVLRKGRVIVNAGVRVDAQTQVGALVSPRLSAAAEWRGFVFRAGAGIFAQPIPTYVLVRAIEGDGTHLAPVLMENAAPDAASAAVSATPPIRTNLSPSLTLPRELTAKVSVNRTFGRFTPGVEYTQSHDWKLLGSQRFADGGGWMDVIASNRARAARQLQTQLSYAWKGQRFTVYDEWLRSYDDTDGPFSFPQQQNNLQAEWARSSGRPSQSVTFAGSFHLHSIYLTLTDSWHGAAPFNITGATDPEGDGLFNDREGRPRNSGNGPAYNSLSGYLSRHFGLPGIFGERLHGVTVGLRGENLLGNRNYLSVGAVAGSATFGKPLAAAPGRSVRLWFSFD